jgi:hypothetical protein
MSRSYAPHRRPASSPSRGSAPDVRQAATPAPSAGRILLAPFALLLAAIAGLVYALLLPICGIASIAEATARASWAIVHDAFRRTRHRAASRA